MLKLKHYNKSLLRKCLSINLFMTGKQNNKNIWGKHVL